VSNIAESSRLILKAYETGMPIRPLREVITSVDDAYAVQMETVKAWCAGGRQLCGHKIGLTSLAVQAQLGVDQPDFGILFADMVLPDKAKLPHNAVLQPRVEAEIAFVLRKDLSGKGITPQDVIEATDYVSPALEICGSRIENWNIKICDTIADNASSGLVVLGEGRFKPRLEDLPGVSVTLEQDGTAVSAGTGAACLDNPAKAVAWLAETLTRRGSGLRAGDLVMSGAMSKMVAAKAGQVFFADFGRFGSVVFEFTH
jgi:2-keto-4-pentenoate hydratase